MNPENSNATVSESKEESILKALKLLEDTKEELPPLYRPVFSTSHLIGVFLIWFFGCCISGCILFFIGRFFHLNAFLTAAMTVFPFVAALIVKAKSLLCNSILLYQKHAPEKLRRACVYTPTCSDYMLLAVEKHGVVKGFFKGFLRLCRCHYPHGGEDLP